MRLPQHLLESPYFVFSTVDEVVKALGEAIDQNEILEITRLSELRLPPVTSRSSLAVMLGINPGFLWSLENRSRRHYRHFTIPKGKSGVRHIDAPKIALKIIQKWLSIHLQANFLAPEHVFGFVPGKSHIKAAGIHCGARWVYSVDIKDFFASTPSDVVQTAFQRMGYQGDSPRLLSSFCCLRARPKTC
jgi:RNA-directed DNA polymerase